MEVEHSKTRYTLWDVYQAAKYEQNFNYSFWLHITFDIMTENAMRYGGYCLVIAASLLIISISFVGFFIIIPAVAEPYSFWFSFNVVWGEAQYMHCSLISRYYVIIGLFMLFSIAFNYFMAVTTKPGKPSDHFNTLHSEHEEDHRHCKKCSFSKPARTHHCSVCKSCVMRMDHHCPWLSNCVGYRNYRYFVSFLIWVTITTSYVTVLCAPSLFTPGSVLFPDDQLSITQSISDAVYNSFSTPQIFVDIAYLFEQRKRDVDNEPLGSAATTVTEENRINKRGKGNNLRGPHLSGSTASVNDPADSAELLDSSHRRLTGQYSAFTELHSHTYQLTDNMRAAPQYIVLNTAMGIYMSSFINTLLRGASSSALDKSQRKLAQHSHRRRPQSYRGASSLGRLQFTVAHWRDLLPPDDWCIFFAFILCVGVTIGTGTLMCFHLFLISKGLTTIEYFEAQMISARLQKEGRVYINPYDKGSFLANMQQVFGEVPWYVMLLPSTRSPLPYSTFMRSNSYIVRRSSNRLEEDYPGPSALAREMDNI